MYEVGTLKMHWQVAHLQKIVIKHDYIFLIIINSSIQMEISCPICYDNYNDKDKIPRIL